MKLVDEDTRREVQAKRLLMLEADNFTEDQGVDISNEDVYGESEA